MALLSLCRSPRGKDSEERDYASFHFASNSNPYFPLDEWEEAKKTLPTDVFRQEYLAEFIEKRQIGWPVAWEVLTDELKRYEYQIIPNGNIIYNAPGGYHDDCVIALALANAQRYQFKPTGAIRLVAAAPRAARLRARGRELVG